MSVLRPRVAMLLSRPNRPCSVRRVDDPTGIAGADAHLGVPFPLPRVPLPLVRWVEVRTAGPGAEIEWNLDDSRLGTPGRLALYAGPQVAPPQLPAGADVTTTDGGWRVARAPLDEAQPSLRPVVEVSWCAGALHLRLTAQGPWRLEQVLAIARSVA
jgi:hypothetical protein